MELKLGYKMTEIGIVPEDWDVSSLEELFEFKNGLNKAKEYFGKGTPIVNYTDVYSKSSLTKVDLQGRVTLSKDEIRRYEVHKGDVFFTRTSETPEEVGISSVAIDEFENTVFSGFVLRARSLNETLDLNYKKYCFQTKHVRKAIITGCTYTTRALTNGTQLSRIKIPIPTLSEQRLISDALSDIGELVSSLEKLIAKKQAIKQGAMQQLLTCKKRLLGFNKEWKLQELGLIANINMGQSPLSAGYNIKGEGIPLIQGNTDLENRKTIRRYYTSIITKVAQAGDIIMTVRAPVGSVGIALFECCIGRGVCSITFENDYLYHYLIFIENTWSKLSTGSTFESISSNQLYLSKVYMPVDENEQIAIASILSDMDNEIEALEKKLKKYCNIKQGMMEELLTGCIRLVKITKKVQPKKKEKAQNHNEHFNEAVVLSALVAMFSSEQYPVGRFKRQKLAYLLHRHCEGSTSGFLKKAAGPYNPSIKYKDETIAHKNKYVKECKTDKAQGLVPSENIEQAIEYFKEWYGEDAITWLEQFHYTKNDELELLATVDMAITDLKTKQQIITVDTVKSIICSNKEWKPKLERATFSDKNIQKAIQWSRELFGDC